MAIVKTGKITQPNHHVTSLHPQVRKGGGSSKQPAARTEVSSSTAASEAGAANPAAGGAKPKTFPCLECGKVFNAHYNLTRHMPVHTGKGGHGPLNDHAVQFFMTSGNGYWTRNLGVMRDVNRDEM